MKPSIKTTLALYPELRHMFEVDGTQWLPPSPGSSSEWLDGAALLQLRNMSYEEAYRFLIDKPPTPEAILELIHLATELGKSARSSEIASRKNLNAREFTQAEWQREKAQHPTLSKRDFAEIMVPRLAKRPHSCPIRAETIAYAWLKGL